MSTKWNQIPSKIEAIEKLRLHPLPTKPVDVARAVRIDTTFVMVDKTGRVYSSQASSRMYWTNLNRVERTVACLVKLGMLSTAAIDQYKAAVATEAEARKRYWASDAILQNIDDAGIKLTAAQALKLKKQTLKAAA